MNIKKVIRILYQSLFFFVPLILFPYTSELFEFNKMVVVYLLTILIVFFWSVECVVEKRFILKKTLLDIPLLLFLGSQTISTIVSVDARTSLLGYYSRFNGGLLSLIAYCLLYWGYVSNLDRKDTVVIIKTAILSTFLSCLYGILEHFGIDKNVWIQDVQNRVFSTFGQPNWLAAWIVCIIPVCLSHICYTTFGKPSTFPDNNSKVKSQKSKLKLKIKKYIYFILSQVFFITLLFTKSRSGILGFGIAYLIYWGILFFTSLKEKQLLKRVLSSFSICFLSFAILALAIGTPWTPSVFNQQSNKVINSELTTPAPALEVGGSSSVEIRKIVWQGAVDVWKHYPLFGSGVETFAFSYYQFRPVAHNMVSEWDFLYNKAHNEYLNFMATTGSVGILTYVALIICSLCLFIKIIIQQLKTQNSKLDSDASDIGFRILNIGLLSGYVSILVTNFFGFSVVPVNLLFYLFPAMALTINSRQETGNSESSFVPLGGTSADKQVTGYKNLTQGQKVISSLLLFIVCCLLLFTIRYWYADVLYNKAIKFSHEGKLIDRNEAINSAIKLSPGEAIFYSELADTYTDIALIYLNQENAQTAEKFANLAIATINKAETLSPKNLNILRNKARISIALSQIKPSLILDAKKTLQKAVELAPTEAKLVYNLALTHYRIGETDKAVELMKKTIDMKSNYKDARYAYAIILSEEGDVEDAKQQLNYILEKLDADNPDARKLLEELN